MYTLYPDRTAIVGLDFIALLSSEHVPWRMVSRAAEKVVNVGGDFSMASTVEQGERPPLAVGIS